MTVSFTQRYGAGAYVIWQEDINVSRQQIVIGQSTQLFPGQVLGKVTATGKYLALNPAASDGTQNAVAILFDGVNATTRDVPAVAHVRGAAVKQPYLIFAAGMSDDDIAAAVNSLLSVGIVCEVPTGRAVPG